MALEFALHHTLASNNVACCADGLVINFPSPFVFACPGLLAVNCMSRLSGVLQCHC